MTGAALTIPGQMTFDDVLDAVEAPDTVDEVVEVLEEAPSPPPLDPPRAEEQLGPATQLTVIDPGGTDDHDGRPGSVAPIAEPRRFDVEVIRSTKRRKTAQAQMVGSVLEVRIPSRCSADEERDLVEHFRAKFERTQAAADLDLDERAAELADRFGLPRPDTIRWVTNQQRRWGSCTPVDRSIRLSDRMAGFPLWVVDYVIVHELAHLVIDVHSAEFWALVDRYPLTERARGFLIAKSDES